MAKDKDKKKKSAVPQFNVEKLCGGVPVYVELGTDKFYGIAVGYSVNSWHDEVEDFIPANLSLPTIPIVVRLPRERVIVTNATCTPLRFGAWHRSEPKFQAGDEVIFDPTLDVAPIKGIVLGPLLPEEMGAPVVWSRPKTC